MSTLTGLGPLQARTLLRPQALVYLYARRLRVHLVQELLAGLGVAVAVALVFASMVANASVVSSASEVVHAVVGPANLELRARDTAGLDPRLLDRVKRIPGVEQVAPLLEQTATLLRPDGRQATVNLVGTDARLARLDGLARTLPVGALEPGSIGITSAAARELHVPRSTTPQQVDVELRGRRIPLKIAALLGPEIVGALAQARVAVMPLARLQRLSDAGGRSSRILIKTRPGREASVRAALSGLAGSRLSVAAPDAEVAQLRQALRPSDQASGFFGAISALLGFLFAFNAMMLTVPERRAAIADLRLIGAKRSSIVQIVLFQALCLGLAASLVGLLAGYVLAVNLFHQSSGYLAEAFTLGTNTIVGTRPLVVALLGGLLATLLASTVPLLDLYRGRAIDAVYFDEGAPGNALARGAQVRLVLLAVLLVALTTLILAFAPSLALLACGLLALATVLSVPVAFALVRRAGELLVGRFQGLTSLQVALTSLKAATVRSLALAATGAVAIFGGIALGGSRNDLLRGIGNFAHSYAADADLWVTNPGDNQATVTLRPDVANRVAGTPGVASISRFQGGFLDFGDRRIWLIARPPGKDMRVLSSQIVDGNVAIASRRLDEGGWIVASQQIAGEYHTEQGGSLTLPTPAGPVRFKLAATTTNLAWSSGAIFMAASDYRRYWGTAAPTALGVEVTPATGVGHARSAVMRSLGGSSALEVSTARAREARIDTLTREGLSRLGEISTLLITAAILAMAAALATSIWQRRSALAAMRLSGVRAHRLRRILLTESLLMLSAGCATGAIIGIYGELVIDSYLKHITGFPVAKLAASSRPFEILAIVVAVAMAVVAVPVWTASRVPPKLALDDE